MKISSISQTSYSPSAVSQMVWTNQQVTQLRNYVNQGLSLNVIAQRFNCSAAAVRLEATSLGLNLNTK